MVSTGSASAAPRTLSVNNASVNSEGDPGDVRKAAFVVKLSRVHDKKVTVDYTTKDKTAEAGSDYVAKNGTLSFRVGQKKKTVRVGVIEDDVHELVETFALKLKNASRATIADRTGIGTINDDDAPTINAVDASLGESNEGFINGLFVVVFSLSHPSPLPISVNVTLAPDSTGVYPATPDTDYLDPYDGNFSTPTTVTVPPGETGGWYDIRFRGDNIDEFNETYLAVLSAPTNGATIADDTSVITILDND